MSLVPDSALPLGTSLPNWGLVPNTGGLPFKDQRLTRIEEEIGELKDVIKNITTLKKYVKYLLLDDPCLAPPEADLLALVPYDEPFHTAETLPIVSNPSQVTQYGNSPILATGSKVIMQRRNRFLFGVPVSESELAKLRQQIAELLVAKSKAETELMTKAAALTKSEKICQEVIAGNKRLADTKNVLEGTHATTLVELDMYKKDLAIALMKLEEYREHERTPLIREASVAAIPLDVEPPEPEKPLQDKVVYETHNEKGDAELW